MSVKRLSVFLVATLLLSASAAMAQPDKPWKSWFGQIQLGYSMPQGDAGDALDDGWNISGAAIYKPEAWPVGLILELGYQQFDLSRDVLNAFEAQGGDMDIWTVTGGGMWSTKSQGKVNFYLEGQVGWYRTEAKLTEAAAIWVPGYCGWYWCYPPGWVPGDVITDSKTENVFGGNLGIGLNFNLGNDSQIYLEARYQYADTEILTTEWVPVSIGYRW
jgi:opacity protein-like surface antigen